MASVVNLLRTTLVKRVNSRAVRPPIMQHMRQAVTTDSGAILERPEQVRFGLLKATAVVIPFLYAGATISKNGAAFLEENDIFVPDDDDD